MTVWYLFEGFLSEDIYMREREMYAVKNYARGC